MSADPKPAVNRVSAWQCIGCGKIEAPQPCIGVCRDRKTELVYAEDYDALSAHAAGLAAIAREIAMITPREGEWERSYKALQRRARRALQILADRPRASEGMAITDSSAHSD